jgi:hypothetical protein
LTEAVISPRYDYSAADGSVTNVVTPSGRGPVSRPPCLS